MTTPARTARDLEGLARQPGGAAPRVSRMAGGLIGSEILKIAADIRGLVAEGRTICNLTVGDFDPRQFPIPDVLRGHIVAALEAGQTNYPPPNGMPELREAVRRFYDRELGLRYPVDSVLIAGGARPVIHATYTTLCDPGDRVVYPVPSWNNNHYCHMIDAVSVPVPCGPETRFLPTADSIARNLPGARLVCINSPLNPSGTAMTSSQLSGICEAILAENRQREARGERPCYLMYDHIYWMLCVGVAHVTPPELHPEMARYTIFIDGISKAFAATGLRVGWAVGPADIVTRMSAVLGHVGAWAPRAEQVATARMLDDVPSMASYHATFQRKIQVRLQALHDALQAMRAEGLAVESIPPTGAIYLTARLHPFGRRGPDGRELATNEDVRRFVLDHAGVGIVPFQAFGSTEDSGWFRMSVGAVSEDEIAAAMPRLAAALRGLDSPR